MEDIMKTDESVSDDIIKNETDQANKKVDEGEKQENMEDSQIGICVHCFKVSVKTLTISYFCVV